MQKGIKNTAEKHVHILRHGQISTATPLAAFCLPPSQPALHHSVHEAILSETHHSPSRAFLKHPPSPFLIVCSPMRPTIQTALTAFAEDLEGVDAVLLEIWPDLREANDAICNKGVSRAILVQAFPMLDFSLCSEEWDCEEHTDVAANKRAGEVRMKLRTRKERNIILVSHRAIITYLADGPQFAN